MASLIHATAHGLIVGDEFYVANFEPGTCGLVEGTPYYVITVPDDDSLTFSETAGGTEFILTEAMTYGDLIAADQYIPDPETVHTPPTTPTTPGNPPILTSTEVSGIVRLLVEVPSYEDTAVRIRETEVSITHKYDGATPVWDNALVLTLPSGVQFASVPALGSTLYASRTRVADVYGNFSEPSTIAELTTDPGVDSLNIADGAITTVKIADDAISTPKLQAQSITAGLLASTIVLASLIKTGNDGTRRVEIDSTGIRLMDSDNSLMVNIPTNGDPVFVKGTVTADSLISQTIATLRTAVSLEGSAVMTVQGGVANPGTAPTVTASLDYLTLTTSPTSVLAAAGIAFDADGTDSFWIACDPSVSPYIVAREYNASTGALIGSISATGSSSVVTTTLGSTSHVSDGANGRDGNTDSHFATPLTMPRDGRVTKVAVYLAGHSGSASCRNAIYSDVSGTGNLLRESATYTAADGGATGVGDSILYNRNLSSNLTVVDGQVLYVGARHTSSGEGFQWDFDSGSSKSTYLGDTASDADGTGWGLYSSSQKPNVYITYEYDVDTRLETLPNIGIASDGTHVYTLDTSGVVWKYLIATGAWVANSAVQTAITGTKSKAGLFYDATANELIITTTSGTGAGVYPKAVRVDPSTLAVSSTVYTAATGSTFSGTTDTFRGGARIADPLNGSAATYFLATTSAVYAYTFSGTTLTNVANRDFGQAVSMGDGLTYDTAAGEFRGWDTAAPTKVHKFTVWDWTSASAIYWFAYSWHLNGSSETGISPRTSLTLRRRERVAVQNPSIPAGTDRARVYTLPNATEPAVTAYKRQVTDALITRYLVTYDSAGSADIANNFAAGTAAIIKSAVSGWQLNGDGTATLGLLTTGGKPPVRRVYTTANDGTGAWTVPAGLKYIEVEVVGGGGAGSGVADPAAGQTTFGGGGGGGGYAKKLLTAADLAGDSAYDITIAAAAAGDANSGAAGGTCSFAGTGISTVQATGGGGGTTGATGTSLFARGGGSGGIGSGGDINVQGNPGHAGARLSATQAWGGAGGGTVLGGGGTGTYNISSGVASDGDDGGAYGGGGAGATSLDGGDATTAIGGDGAEGVVIVTEYYS